jgi:hypothetical protein
MPPDNLPQPAQTENAAMDAGVAAPDVVAPDVVMRAIREQVRRSLDQPGQPAGVPAREPAAGPSAASASTGRTWRELRHKLYLASEHHAVRELPFESSAPVVGRLLVAFRNAWNNVACKWHVRRLLIQQNAYNLDLLQTLQALTALAQQQEERLAALEAELAALRGNAEPPNPPDDERPAP